MTRTLVLSSSKIIAVGALTATGVALAGAGVYAGLTATAVRPQQVTSGTLKLAANDVGAGFSQSIGNLAPGDHVTRYVTVENTGSLAAQGLTVSITDSTPTKLSTDALEGLGLNIRSCPTPWNTTTGVCGTGTGGPSTQGYTDLAEATVWAIATPRPPHPIPAVTNPGDKLHLRIETYLPNQDETTVNGELPPDSVQGLTANLTYTFKQVQRTGARTTG